MKTIEFNITLNSSDIVITEFTIDDTPCKLVRDGNAYKGTVDIDQYIPGKIRIRLAGTAGITAINSIAGTFNLKYNGNNVFKKDQEFRVKGNGIVSYIASNVVLK